MPTAKPHVPLALLHFPNRDDLAAWLHENHAASSGIWLRIAKKGSGKRSVTYAEAVEEALRYGWIDGTAQRIDDEFYKQKLTPRAKRSIWSKINRDKALALMKAGRMEPAGLAEVERAKADGRWDAAYAGPRTIEVPDDFAAALAKNTRASRFFEALDSRNRYAVLFRIHGAKKPETRAKRIAQFTAMLAKGEKLHP
jgi:uncharacterized protein YdeI (YjbR/CyaY-like superfamily)